MLPPKCFTCGHILAHLQIPYENGLLEIDNDINLNENEKMKKKQELINRLLPDIWNQRYCCRARLISYIDVIKLII